jgi:hypothetical protein
MKKSKSIMLCIAFLLVTYSCHKDFNTSNTDNAVLIDQAKSWYLQKMKSNIADNHFSGHTLLPQLFPDWENFIVKRTGTNDGTIIVKAEGWEINNPKYGMTSSIIFSYKNGSITAGNRVNVIGDASYIKEQGLDLTSKYNNKSIPGFNNGAYIVYDIYYNAIVSHNVVNGSVTETASVIQTDGTAQPSANLKIHSLASVAIKSKRILNQLRAGY